MKNYTISLIFNKMTDVFKFIDNNGYLEYDTDDGRTDIFNELPLDIEDGDADYWIDHKLVPGDVHTPEDGAIFTFTGHHDLLDILREFDCKVTHIGMDGDRHLYRCSY